MARGRFAALAHGLPCPTGRAFEIAPRGGLLLPAPLYWKGICAVLDAPIGTLAIFCTEQPPWGLRRFRVESRGSDLLRPRGSPIRLRLVAVLFFCGAAGAGFAADHLWRLRLMKPRAAARMVQSLEREVRIHQTKAKPSCSPGRSRRSSAVQSCGAVSAAGVSAEFRLAFAQSAVPRAAGLLAAGLAGPGVSDLRPLASPMSRLAPRRSPARAPACRMCQPSPILPRALSRSVAALEEPRCSTIPSLLVPREARLEGSIR